MWECAFRANHFRPPANWHRHKLLSIRIRIRIIIFIIIISSSISIVVVVLRVPFRQAEACSGWWRAQTVATVLQLAEACLSQCPLGAHQALLGTTSAHTLPNHTLCGNSWAVVLCTCLFCGVFIHIHPFSFVPCRVLLLASVHSEREG